jgi:hypothetical protein
MAIALDATSQGDTNSGTSLSVAHVCTGSNRLLLAGATTWAASAGPATLTATYNGVSMVNEEDIVFDLAAGRLVLFRLAAPATGSNNLVVTLSKSSECSLVIASYTGAHQTDFTGASGQNSSAGLDGNPTLASPLSSAATERAISVMAAYNPGSIVTDEPLTERVENLNGATINSIALGDRAGAASTATDWTLGAGRRWAVASKCYLPAPAGGGGGPVGVAYRRRTQHHYHHLAR